MAKIELRKLRKVFRARGREICAVKDIDLRIEDGEFVTLVGPSGCGKTTSLRMIAGLEAPTSGEIIIGDEDITRMPPQKRDLSMVFQNIAIYPHMTASQNIAYPLKIRNYSMEEIQRKVGEVAELLHISDLLNSYPNELSGGQRQRVALGRAIIIKPKAFLLDEPMAALDAKLKYEIRKEIQLIHKEIGGTIVYVTHDQEEAMTASDRIAVMRDGEILQVGKPEEIYGYPRNRFIAAFFGHPEMNILEVNSFRINHTKRSLTLALSNSYEIELPFVGSDERDVFKDLGKIYIGFRPETIVLEEKRQKGLSGKIKLIEPMGDREIVYLDSAVDEIRATISTSQKFEYVKEGREVGITFPTKHIHLFNADGNRVDKIIN
jgi:multiple sugar transport system ATP-binding protein